MTQACLQLLGQLKSVYPKAKQPFAIHGKNLLVLTGWRVFDCHPAGQARVGIVFAGLHDQQHIRL